MPEVKLDSMLPHVTEDDLLSLVYEDVLDPYHLKRWKEFATDNPELAREVLKRSWIGARKLAAQESDVAQLQKYVIDLVTFSIHALKVASQRTPESSSDTA
jgi:hypothetical protein